MNGEGWFALLDRPQMSSLRFASGGAFDLSSLIAVDANLGVESAAAAADTMGFAETAGAGLGSWEIHRAQRAVRQLVAKQPAAFSGNVLDVGCGLGDNALFIASSCPCTVTALDIVPQCLDFAAIKAAIRPVCDNIQLVTANILDLQSPLARCQFDVILDSLVLHHFQGQQREQYLQVLSKMLKPGGKLYVLCLSDSETRAGGFERFSQQSLQQMFCEEQSWHVVSIEDAYVEYHPTFWGGKAKGYFCQFEKL